MSGHDEERGNVPEKGGMRAIMVSRHPILHWSLIHLPIRLIMVLRGGTQTHLKAIALSTLLPKSITFLAIAGTSA